MTFNVDATSTRIETNAMVKVCTARLTLRFLSPPRDDDFSDFEYWYFSFGQETEYMFCKKDLIRKYLHIQNTCLCNSAITLILMIRRVLVHREKYKSRNVTQKIIVSEKLERDILE